MRSGEFLTRMTIWIAIAGYAIGTVVFATARRGAGANWWTRWAWTIGCAALFAHFASAYEFYHAWSHASAYADTARQTAEVFKVNWGGGLFINYAVAALWLADVAWWWIAGLDSYRRRPWSITLLWHGFLIFIIFNATVVFKDGLIRWIGLFICVVLCVSWVSIRNEFNKR
ncbi:MAG TPA: hypothetical protein VFZ71_01815 [Pyrinomonadaceae bacterium]